MLRPGANFTSALVSLKVIPELCITFRTCLSFWCAYVLPLPFLWLKAIMQRIFVSARKHLPCRGAVQRLSTATTATRKTLNKLTCERVVRAPKGSLGPKGPIREIDPGSLWSYLTPLPTCPKAQIWRVCGHDRTPCSITKPTHSHPRRPNRFLIYGRSWTMYSTQTSLAFVNT